MAYKDFNIIDTLLSLVGFILDEPTKELIKKTGITEEQINKTTPLLTSYFAKLILYDFIIGCSNFYSYDLYPGVIFSLKQFTLALNDISLKEKVSLFLQNPNIETAQEAIQEFSKFEVKHFSKEQIDTFYNDKIKELK